MKKPTLYDEAAQSQKQLRARKKALERETIKCPAMQEARSAELAAIEEQQKQISAAAWFLFDK